MLTHDGLPHLRFDTAALPGAQQFDAWQSAVSVTHEVRPLRPDNAGFAANADIWLLGPLLLSAGGTDAQHFARSEQRARRDGIDHYSLLLMERGSWQGDLAGREITAGPGSLCLRDMAGPLATRVTDSEHLMVMLPRDMLDGVLPPRAEGHGLMLQDAIGALLADHLRALARLLPQMTAADVPVVVQATRQMVAACLAPTPEALARARHPLVAASLRGARRLIESRLQDQGLTPEFIAQSLGLSRSTLYRLFEPLGGIFTYIRERRLVRIHALLADPAIGLRISEIAFAYGFTSEAHFSRVFRRAFGYSPSEARSASILPQSRRKGPAHDTIDAPLGYRNWVRMLRE